MTVRNWNGTNTLSHTDTPSPITSSILLIYRINPVLYTTYNKYFPAKKFMVKALNCNEHAQRMIIITIFCTWMCLVGSLNVCTQFGEEKKNEKKIITIWFDLICCFTSLIQVNVNLINVFNEIVSNEAFSLFPQQMWAFAHVSLCLFPYTQTTRNNFNLPKIAKINAK